MKFASIFTLLLFIPARWASADTMVATTFIERSADPIVDAGVAWCPHACNSASLFNAIASFELAPMPGGTDASNSAFGPNAEYLRTTRSFERQSWTSVETQVRSRRNGLFLQVSSLRLATETCPADSIPAPVAYPVPKREIDSLVTSGSPSGEIKWQATGADIVPEPPGLFWLPFAALAVVALFSRLRARQKRHPANLPDRAVAGHLSAGRRSGTDHR